MYSPTGREDEAELRKRRAAVRPATQPAPAPYAATGGYKPGSITEGINFKSPLRAAAAPPPSVASEYGAIESPLASRSTAQHQQAAQQKMYAERMGGVPMSIAGATAMGARDAQGILANAARPKSPAETVPIGKFSPLRGDAANFQALNDITAQKKAADDQYNAWEAKKNTDANGNGIPDRDEAVASKWGTAGINNINDLSRINAKYNVYMRGYKSDSSARATSRPMTFDEFAKAEHKAYQTRPVYGAEPSQQSQPADANQVAGAERPPSPLTTPGSKLVTAPVSQEPARPDPLAAAMEAGRQSARDDRAAKENRRVNHEGTSYLQGLARERFALNNMATQARAMGYTPQQAAAMAQNRLGQQSVLDERQRDREGVLGLEELRQKTELEKQSMAADVQREGYKSQEQIARDNSIAQMGLAGLNSQAQVQMSTDRNATALQVAEAQAKSQVEQIKAKMADPSARADMAIKLNGMNPAVLASQAGRQAAAEFSAANPSATLPQIQAAQQRAYESAYQSSLPLWQTLMSDPELNQFMGSSPVTQGVPATGLPVSTGAPGMPPVDDLGGGSPIVPGPGYQQLPIGTGGQVSQVVRTLKRFYGRLPTREEIEEQIRSEGGAFRLPDNYTVSDPDVAHTSPLESNYMF